MSSQPSEYASLEQLLCDVYENEVEISRNRREEESRDIKDAVNDFIEDFLFRTFETDEVFHIPREEIPNHLLLVGGVGEETKINDLDEFDYTFIFPQFNSNTIKVSDRVNGRILNRSPFRQIRYHGPKEIKRKLLERCLLAKINSDVYLSALDLRRYLESRFQRCLIHFFIRQKLQVDKSTGHLVLNYPSFVQHGPAFTLYFRWRNTADIMYDREGLFISVDITATIVSRDDSLFENVIAVDEYREILQEVAFGNLIPQNLDMPIREGINLAFGRIKYTSILESDDELIFRCTFRISFVQAELQIMRKIKDQQSGWFKCYKLLKLLFMRNKKHFGNLVFSSYVLKTLVFTKRQQIADSDANTIAPKFMAVLDEIIDILKQYRDKPLDVGYECVPSIWFDQLSAMHTLIPVKEEMQEAVRRLQRDNWLDLSQLNVFCYV